MSDFSVQFIDDKQVLHLEVGAGIGNFGKLFYPKCYLTDKDISLRTGFHIDWVCDAHELPWGEDRFEKIIICNPYGYGFKDPIATSSILQEMLRVLKNGSQIIVICHATNKYAANIEKRVLEFSIEKGVPLSVERTNIYCTRDYPNYRFTNTGGFTETTPNLRFVIHVSK
jgi:ubiquinone/menaquinone biosynthesis C-methylase UbiE